MKRVTSQGAGGEKTKAKNSIKAIKLLKELERDGRMATPSEQDILAGFNGWGSIATVFSNAPEWKALHDELKEILTDEEYKTARKVALNAFYTEPSIVKAIWEGVKRLGFNGGRVFEAHNGRGVVFATGTPISNSMNEMFTMMRYLMGEKLKFSNLRALGRLFRTFADIKLPSDLPYLERPKLKGDARTVISVPASDAFSDYKQELLARSNAIKSNGVDRHEDNMLKLTNDFRNASMDMRLVNPSISKEEAGGKIAALVDNIARVYEESKEVKGAQVVFSDIGVPKPKKDKEAESSAEDFDDAEESQEAIIIYDKIKKELIARGIPENEIGFVHDAKNAKQRQALFTKVNKGEIRVFIGSTGKMGAGVNFQHHLIALHHLDCPWKPRDIEQREGRILRAGNENPEVQIYSYVTEGSFDANMWDKVSYKQRMIDSVMSGDPLADEMDDINSDTSASFADIEALAMDNPLMADRVKVNANVTRLQALAKAFNTKRRNIQYELNSLPGKISALESSIERAKEDVKRLVSTRGEDFKIKIGDKVFTKRADAKGLWDKIVESFSKDISTKVGEIGGLEVHMLAKPKGYKVDGKAQDAHDVTVQLVGSGAYTVGTSLESLESKVNGGIKKELEKKQSELQELKDRQADLEKELAEPFQKQTELNDAIKELADIDAALKAIDDAKKQGREIDSAKVADTIAMAVHAIALIASAREHAKRNAQLVT